MENSSTSTTLTTPSVSSSQTVTTNHEVKTRNTTSDRVQPSIRSTISEPTTTMNTVSNESRTSTRSSLDTNTNTHNAPKLWHRSAAASAGAVLVSLFTTPLDVVRVRMQSSASKDLNHGYNVTNESHLNSKETFKSRSSPTLSVQRSDTLLHDHKVLTRNVDHTSLQHVSEIPKHLEISYNRLDSCKGNDGLHWNQTRVIPRSRWWYTFESYVPQFWPLRRHLEVPMTSICHNCPGKLHAPFGLDDLSKHSNTKTKNAPFSRFWRNVVGICRCVDATNRTSNALSSYSSSRMVAERFRSMQKAIKMRAAYSVPIDSIQQETSKYIASDISTMKDSVASRMRLSSLSVLREIVRSEGISTLWSGLSPSLLMAIPSTTLYFIAYDELKLWLESLLPSRQTFVTNVQQDNTTMNSMVSLEHPLHPYVPLVAGSVARTIAATVISPLELIRTRMQSGQSKFGVIESLRNEVLRSRGISSLWRGLIPTLYRDVPFSGIYWFGYERVKHHLRPLIVEKKAYAWSCNQDHTLATAPSVFFDSWILSFISGSIAGSFAALITTPFDVVKTYRQANLSEHTQLSTGKHATVETRTIPILRSIVHRRGWPGMFAGVGPRLAKVAPACAIMVSSYELGKMLFMHSPAAAEQ